MNLNPKCKQRVAYSMRQSLQHDQEAGMRSSGGILQEAGLIANLKSDEEKKEKKLRDS
jgi:hypothetical protein